MINVEDVIDNCELAFISSGRKPLAIRKCAENMRELYSPDPASPVGELIEKLAVAPSPRIFLNAIVASGQYQEAAV